MWRKKALAAPAGASRDDSATVQVVQSSLDAGGDSTRAVDTTGARGRPPVLVVAGHRRRTGQAAPRACAFCDGPGALAGAYGGERRSRHPLERRGTTQPPSRWFSRPSTRGVGGRTRAPGTPRAWRRCVSSATPPGSASLYTALTPEGGEEMAKDHGSSVKDDKQYEGLRKKGMSKERAAKIANTPDASSKGGKNSNKGGSSQSSKSSGKGSGGNRAQKQAAGRKGGRAPSPSCPRRDAPWHRPVSSGGTGWCHPRRERHPQPAPSGPLPGFSSPVGSNARLT